MQNNVYQVGVTGGIGSGKSTVCRIFDILGVACYNADKRARWLIENSPEVVNGIKLAFGSNAYIDNRINRKLIAKVSFTDQDKLEELNAIVHPQVAVDYKLWIDEHHDHNYIIKEAALIFESESHKLLDRVINVTSSDLLRINRVIQRDPFRSESEIADIMDKQMTDDQRNKLADYQVFNDESKPLIHQVLSLHRTFTNG